MRVVLIGLVCALALSCGESSGPPLQPPPPPRAVAKLALVSGQGQTGEVGTQLAEPIVVLATDSSDARVRGARIFFSVGPAPHPAATNPVVAVTDESGTARTRWTLGPIAGHQILTADTGFAAASSTGWPTTRVSVTATASPGSAVAARTDVGSVAAVTLGDTAWIGIVGIDRFGNDADLPRSVVSVTSRVLDAGIAQVAAIEEVTIPPPTARRYQRVVVLGRDRGSTRLELMVSGNGLSAAVFRLEVPVYAGPGRDIAFTRRDTDGVERIYLASADGTRLTALADGREPAWSPDGREIAFTTRRPSPILNEVELMNADGSGRRQLLTESRGSAQPAWSPDGRQLAIVTGSSNGRSGVHVVDRDGSTLRNLCPTPGHLFCGGGDRLNWSPDGSVISYAIWVIIHGGGTHRPIVFVNVDGSGTRLLSQGGGSKLFAREPTWSPDGREILFQYSGLQIIRPDGTGLRAVPRTFGEWPAWSPDSRIALARVSPPVADLDRSGGRYGLFVVNADGTELRRVMGGDVLHPAWRPTPP